MHDKAGEKDVTDRTGSTTGVLSEYAPSMNVLLSRGDTAQAASKRNEPAIDDNFVMRNDVNNIFLNSLGMGNPVKNDRQELQHLFTTGALITTMLSLGTRTPGR